MARRWDEMDRKVWDSSEVMQEFEKRILKLADDFRLIVEAENVFQKSKEDTEALRDAAMEAKPAVEGLVDTITKSYVSDPEDLGEESNESDDISDEEYSAAKDSLMKELLELSYAAANEGNIKLAYKIERKIYDLEEEFNENL